MTPLPGPSCCIVESQRPQYAGARYGAHARRPATEPRVSGDRRDRRTRAGCRAPYGGSSRDRRGPEDERVLQLTGGAAVRIGEGPCSRPAPGHYRIGKARAPFLRGRSSRSQRRLEARSVLTLSQRTTAEHNQRVRAVLHSFSSSDSCGSAVRASACPSSIPLGTRSGSSFSTRALPKKSVSRVPIQDVR